MFGGYNNSKTLRSIEKMSNAGGDAALDDNVVPWQHISLPKDDHMNDFVFNSIFLPVDTFEIAIIGGTRYRGTRACIYDTSTDTFTKLEV